MFCLSYRFIPWSTRLKFSMPSWWGKSSSKEAKRKTSASKESLIDVLQRKFKFQSDGKLDGSPRGSRRRCSDTISERGTQSRAESRSPSPSKHVARCQSFAERPLGQPLPLPRFHSANVGRTDSGISVPAKPRVEKSSKSSLFRPLPRPACIGSRPDPADLDSDLVTASVSGESSIDSDDQTDSRVRSPQASDGDNMARATAGSPSSAMLKEQGNKVVHTNSREPHKPINMPLMSQKSSASPRRRPLRNHVPNLQVPPHGAIFSAPDSSMSSPSRSPKRALGNEQAVNTTFWAGKPFTDVNLLSSGHGSSPGSGQNSGHNSMAIGGEIPGQLVWQPSRGSPEYSPIPSPRMASPGAGSRVQSGAVTPIHPRTGGAGSSGQNSGHNSMAMGADISGQFFWQPSRGSPEYSPIPSPRMASPGAGSRVQSGAVTPIHPRAGGAGIETHAGWNDDGKQQSHRLPLPPISIPHSSPFSRGNSAVTSPSVPRSPARMENPASPGSRWKKGKLLGRGTFGHVYIGFNSETGEMCAMKEVTLFTDDAKSRESAKQLAQEIALLSKLRHPNIVQYHGSETVDDKLYIYLEYVSGGSIYKILQEYGKLGEAAIRNYTHQILSGLAYLHGKQTVHRDIKGANILVDPSGWVKLADFGMAKHIAGQSCPLSFKGSPYWMAPEVIKNSTGCNLGVDIWSLGCTVLEMATTKPPWSQYEGVAAMFKIGNSKELPAIPDHLSEEGKDFVRLCLQRNPHNRPTAAQLLDHPFVRTTSPVERPLPLPEAPDPRIVVNGIKALGIGLDRNISSEDNFERLAVHSSRVSPARPHSSEYRIPRNISCPVSPIGSPLAYPRSPPQLHGIMSPSPISSPRTASGASTPLTGGTGAIPFHLAKQPAHLQEGSAGIPKSPNSVFFHVPLFPDPNQQFFHAIHPGPHVLREMVRPERDSGAAPQGRPIHRNLYNGQSILADRVSQQLLRDRVKLNPSPDFTPNSTWPTRNHIK